MKQLMFRIVLVGVVLVPLVSAAQGNTVLPVATTVDVLGERTPGTVVRYDREQDTYAPTSGSDDDSVYGVVAERPAVVFVTGETAVPVVTDGVTPVRVVGSVVPLTRGTILAAASSSGLARAATLDDGYPFAIVREVVSFTAPTLEYVVLAEVGVERATAALQAERRIVAEAAASGSADDDGWSVSWWRAGVATVVAVGSLLFMLVSVRFAIGKALQAVGRNPRARTTIFILAASSIFGTFVLGVLVILVAVGILVLPLA